jgi:hypothetical protein
MEISGIYDKCGVRYYETRGEMTTDKFKLLANRLATAFDVVPNLFWMPEADVATITVSEGRIYAKYDADYGLEIESTGLSGQQQSRLEEILLAF